jgi:hypothetical protein
MKKIKQSPKSLAMISLLLAGGLPGAALATETPLIEAKVSLREGVFFYNERCNDRVAASFELPSLFRLPLVKRGEPLGHEVLFTLASRLLPDRRAEVLIYDTDLDAAGDDPTAPGIHRAVLARGSKKELKMHRWFGRGAARMLLPFRIELRFDGETREVTHARNVACGQIFLETDEAQPPRY